MPRAISLRLVCAFAALLSLTGTGTAADKGVEKTGGGLALIPMRVGEHPDFDRIVFDAPQGTSYSLKRNGDSLTVTFSRAARVTLARQTLARAKGFTVVSGADGAEALAVRFTLAPKAVVNDFYSGASIVLDVKGAAVAEGAASSAPVAEKAAPAAVPSIPVITPEPLPPKAEQAKPAAPVEKAEAKKEPQAAVVVQDVHDLEKLKDVAPPAQAAPATPVTPPKPLPEQKSAPRRPLVAEVPFDPAALAQIRSILKETPSKPVAILDPKVSVGAAVFARGGYVTLLFDRKLIGDSLIGSPPPRVKLEPLELPQNTGYRIAVPAGVGVRATRNDTAWEIYLVREGTEKALSTEFVVQPSFALGARLLVPTGNPPAPIYFNDPVVGDDVIVLPLRETGAFTNRRRMADFQVVPAAQGLVIKPLRDRVIARASADGVEITAEGGLKLSPVQDTGDYGAARQGDQRGKILFDFARWKGTVGDSFTRTRQKLMQTIIEVADDERVLARLDLARFFFANGMGNEALSILNYIVGKLPEIEQHPDFLAVRAGANVLADHYQAAIQDLTTPSLQNQPEAILWQAIAAAGVRDWQTSFEDFSRTMDILLDYPEPMRSRFAVLAIESASAVGNDPKMLDWINRLEKGGYTSEAEPALRYLRGVLYSKTGKTEMAEKLWHEVVKKQDRLYKIRAELALVDLGVASKSLTPKQAVGRLEGLRFAWRGDDLEFDILRRLGGFYLDAKDFKNGFAVLSRALTLFPDSPDTKALRVDMVKTFSSVFLTDMGKDMSPIDALTLYTEYKTLIPAGAEGNAVRKNLAERLISIDLLDQATKLLDDDLKNAPTPEERVKTATRLAGVQLLDHKAEAALAYLDKSQEEAQGQPQAVRDERQLLRVRALSEMGKVQAAVEALPANHDKTTLLLRADIAMRGKNWADAAATLMDLVGPLQADKPLTDERAQWLVQAAVAMAQAGDTGGLDRLAVDYGTAMDRTNKGNLFKIITRPETMGAMKDLQAAQSRLSEVDMFRDVLEAYRTDKNQTKQ